MPFGILTDFFDPALCTLHACKVLYPNHELRETSNRWSKQQRAKFQLVRSAIPEIRQWSAHVVEFLCDFILWVRHIHSAMTIPVHFSTLGIQFSAQSLLGVLPFRITQSQFWGFPTQCLSFPLLRNPFATKLSQCRTNNCTFYSHICHRYLIQHQTDINSGMFLPAVYPAMIYNTLRMAHWHSHISWLNNL